MPYLKTGELARRWFGDDSHAARQRARDWIDRYEIPTVAVGERGDRHVDLVDVEAFESRIREEGAARGAARTARKRARDRARRPADSSTSTATTTTTATPDRQT